MKLFNRAIREDFRVVYISTGLTMNEYHNPIIVSLIKASAPDYWQHLIPEAYISYYRSTKAGSKAKADKLLRGIQDLILNDEKFEEFKVGINEGELIIELDWKGKVTFPPLGEAINQAGRNQKGKQDIVSNLFIRP